MTIVTVSRRLFAALRSAEPNAQSKLAKSPASAGDGALLVATWTMWCANSRNAML